MTAESVERKSTCSFAHMSQLPRYRLVRPEYEAMADSPPLARAAAAGSDLATLCGASHAAIACFCSAVKSSGRVFRCHRGPGGDEERAHYGKRIDGYT